MSSLKRPSSNQTQSRQKGWRGWASNRGGEGRGRSWRVRMGEMGEGDGWRPPTPRGAAVETSLLGFLLSIFREF
ncbi:unnamed protein product [Prunus armeniaca]